MRRRIAISGLAACLGSGVAPGCRKEDGVPGRQTKVVHEGKGEARAAPPRLEYRVPAARGEILGHVRVGDPFGALAKLGNQVLPSDMASRLSPDGIKQVISEIENPVARAVGGHLDLARPIACAVIDPAAHELPLACVFGYTGGLSGLTTDLADAAQLGADGRLRATAGSTPLFFDALDDDIVVTGDAESFRSAEGYLRALARPGGQRDLEAVLHAAHVASQFRPQLTELALRLVREWGGEGVQADTIALGLDALEELAALASYVERVEVHATVAPEGLVVGASAVPVANARLQRVLEQAPALDPALMQWAPAGTMLLATERHDPDDALLAKVPAFARRLAVSVPAAYLEQPVGQVLDGWEALLRSQAETYRPGSMLAVFHAPATPLGAVYVRVLQETVFDGRDRWLKWADEATPERLLGAELGAGLRRLVTWSARRDAHEIEGFPVDAWELRLADETIRALSADARLGELGRDLLAKLEGGGPLLAVHRIELELEAVFVVAPLGSPAYVRKVIHARNGAGRMPTTQVDTILARHPKTRRVVALSAFDLVRALHALLPAETMDGVPDTVGRGLSDAYYIEGVSEDSHAVFEIVLSPSALGAARWLPR